MNKHSFIVLAEDEGKRLDLFITEKLADFSRSRIQKLISEEQVLVNEEKTTNNYRLQENDNILIIIEEAKEYELKAVPMDLKIIYEDEYLCVVDKPSGLVVHPGAGTGEDTLVHGLLAQIEDLSGINGTIRPGIVHRIDKDTSGLLMVAKNDLAHEMLSAQLANKSAKRLYIALVHGVISHQAGKINAPIGRSSDDRKKMTVSEKGKEAITHFNVLKRFNNFTLIECQLETGRTHQIRVHLNYIGFPVYGDPVYGPKKTVSENGQFLHAKTIGFKHPKSNKYLEFSSELPKFFNDFISDLERSEL
ncbi:MAG: RluA family pseudouridine synthase [Erysipelotrichales bacterium]|nr:RluA family pseudouridine synthase [Erysipelotrichales bacterium]